MICSREVEVMAIVAGIKAQALMLNMHHRRPHRLLTILPMMTPAANPIKCRLLKSESQTVGKRYRPVAGLISPN